LDPNETLYLLCGMIASGKSSFARARADEGALVVCHDDLTAMLHASYRYEQPLRACYRAGEEALAGIIIASGRRVVIDRTHLTRESRERWVRWFRTFGAPGQIVAVTFPMLTPREHAMRRVKADPRCRSFETWLAVAELHAREAEPIRWDEGFDNVILAPVPPHSWEVGDAQATGLATG
jgi:predicted kinase